jgi:hypothetical protein
LQRTQSFDRRKRKLSFGKEDTCKRMCNYSREMDVKRVAKLQTSKNINCLMKEHQKLGNMKFSAESGV